ncbi:MAG: tetratricopeptide repeat protein, partial [Pyrinomonadaceae bacterium]
RLGVIGAVSRPPDDAVPFGDALMSVPTMFAFYLGQIFVPIRLAINYPIMPVTSIDIMNFVVPLIISAAVLAGLFLLVLTSNKNRIAAAIFLLPLIPAMNATAFISEQIVHDRYLYLPLLGVLMLLVPLVTRYVNERHVLIACCVIAGALSVQTFRYNTAFANELSLWTWTSAVDDSSFTSMQLGGALAESGRNDDALAAYSATIEKKPAMRGYLGRGRIYNSLKQYPQAEQDLVKALAMPIERQEAYATYQVYESLGIAYVEQRKLDQAASIFREARNSLPIYKAALTEKLAIVYYQGNLKAEALKELEGAQAQARQELLPESKSVFLRLGMLYQEAGRKDEARNALNEYLRLTASINDKNTVGYRAQASKLLETLR